MKKVNYKKNYCRFFGYSMDNDEWIPSEISGKRACDIHHIHFKQMGGKKTFVQDGKTYDIDDYNNLMAVTRDEHDAIHAHKYDRDELWKIHQRTIEVHLRISKSRMQ